MFDNPPHLNLNMSTTCHVNMSVNMFRSQNQYFVPVVPKSFLKILNILINISIITYYFNLSGLALPGLAASAGPEL